MKLGRFLNSFFSIFNYFREWREYNYLKKLLKDAKRETLLNKVIVLNTVKLVRHFIDREVFIGKLLALNGAKIILLLDDGILAHWEGYGYYSLKNIKKIQKYSLNPYHYRNAFVNIFFEFLKIVLKKKIINKALKTYKDENLKYIYYSDILKNINFENWQDLKKFAESSTSRFFRTSDLDYNDKNIRYYYNLSLKNAILSKNVGEYVYNNIKPDFFITSHGIYSTWGPAYEFLKKKRINCLVLKGRVTQALDFTNIYLVDAKIQKISSCKSWNNFKNTPINEEMIKKVEDYFKSRKNGLSMDTRIFSEKKRLFRINKNDGYKYHVAMFPNVSWDGNIKDRHLVFEGYVDWLITTIKHLKNRKDVKLFIKSHPSEITVLKHSAKIVDLIKSQIKLKNAKNIILIPPEKKIDTYEFLKSGIDLGICYDGFLALEMPLLKIPTIMCVKGGFSSVEGGNIIISNKNEYLQDLDNIDKIIEEFHNNYNKYYNNIIRYLYWYLFKIPIKLPTISKKNPVYTDLFQLTKKDFVLDKKWLNLFIDN